MRLNTHSLGWTTLPDPTEVLQWWSTSGMLGILGLLKMNRPAESEEQLIYLIQEAAEKLALGNCNLASLVVSTSTLWDQYELIENGENSTISDDVHADLVAVTYQLVMNLLAYGMNWPSATDGIPTWEVKLTIYSAMAV